MTEEFAIEVIRAGLADRNRIGDGPDWFRISSYDHMASLDGSFTKAELLAIIALIDANKDFEVYEPPFKCSRY